MRIFLNVWAIFGPLLGIALGSWLTTRTQREHWILDSKREEYRELLTTIADAGTALVVHYGTMPSAQTEDQLFRLRETTRNSVDVIYNRLFIAGSLEKLNILERWQDALSTVRKSRDVKAFGKSMDGIMEDIRKAAMAEFS